MSEVRSRYSGQPKDGKTVIGMSQRACSKNTLAAKRSIISQPCRSLSGTVHTDIVLGSHVLAIWAPGHLLRLRIMYKGQKTVLRSVRPTTVGVAVSADPLSSLICEFDLQVYVEDLLIRSKLTPSQASCLRPVPKLLLSSLSPPRRPSSDVWWKEWTRCFYRALH